MLYTEHKSYRSNVMGRTHVPTAAQDTQLEQNKRHGMEGIIILTLL